MKFAVSNLAWSEAAEPRAFDLLAAHGFGGVEVAPTRIAPWDELDAVRLGAWQSGLAAAGLCVSSLQAIFFGCPQASLLGNDAGFAAMLQHARKVGRIAELLGARIAVFGAPRSRLRGDRPLAEALELGATRLRQLGDIAAAHGLVIGLEPVPPVYGGDFLVRAADVAQMVDLVGHAHIRAHFDCACIMLGGDDAAAAIAASAGRVAHYHAAEPELGPFDAPRSDHAGAAAALHAIGYRGWVVIEMRQQGDTGLDALAVALDAVGRLYRSGPIAATS